MHWKRIVDSGTDRLCGQRLRDLVAAMGGVRREPQRILVKHMCSAGKYVWGHHPWDICQMICVELGVGAAPRIEGWQLFQLLNADRSGHIGHTVVIPKHLVVIACFHAMADQL